MRINGGLVPSPREWLFVIRFNFEADSHTQSYQVMVELPSKQVKRISLRQHISWLRPSIIAYPIDAPVLGPRICLHAHSTSSACQRTTEQDYMPIMRIVVSSAHHGYLLRTQLFPMCQSFENAITVLLALGSSTSENVHLFAIAGLVPRLGPIQSGGTALDEIDWIDLKMSVLVVWQPSGNGYMEDFHWAPFSSPV